MFLHSLMLSLLLSNYIISLCLLMSVAIYKCPHTFMVRLSNYVNAPHVASGYKRTDTLVHRTGHSHNYNNCNHVYISMQAMDKHPSNNRERERGGSRWVS